MSFHPGGESVSGPAVYRDLGGRCAGLAAASRLLMATALLVLSACTTISPVIISQELVLEQTDLSHTPGGQADEEFYGELPAVIARVNRLRMRYLDAVSSETTLSNLISAALIPLSAVAMYRGITSSSDSTQNWLAAAGLTGAAAYAYGSTFTSKPRQLIYVAGADALGCASLAARPYLYRRDEIDSVRPRPASAAMPVAALASPAVVSPAVVTHSVASPDGEVAAPAAPAADAAKPAAVAHDAAQPTPTPAGANPDSGWNSGARPTLLAAMATARRALVTYEQDIAAINASVASWPAVAAAKCGKKKIEVAPNTAAVDADLLRSRASRDSDAQFEQCMKSPDLRAVARDRVSRELVRQEFRAASQLAEKVRELVGRGEELFARIRLAPAQLTGKAREIQSQVAAEVIKTQPDLSAIFAVTEALRHNAFRFSGATLLAPATPGTPSGVAKAEAGVGVKAAPGDAATQAVDAMQQAGQKLAASTADLQHWLQQADMLSRQVAGLSRCRFNSAAGNALLMLNPESDEIHLGGGETFTWVVSGGSGVPRAAVLGTAVSGVEVSVSGVNGLQVVTLKMPETVPNFDFTLLIADGSGVARREVRVRPKGETAGVADGSPPPPAADNKRILPATRDNLHKVCAQRQLEDDCLGGGPMKDAVADCRAKLGLPGTTSSTDSRIVDALLAGSCGKQ